MELLLLFLNIRFFNYIRRAVLDLRINPAHVLADNAHGNQLNAAHNGHQTHRGEISGNVNAVCQNPNKQNGHVQQTKQN